MKLVLAITALGAGGAERVLITLANAWADRGWQVTLVTFEPPGAAPYYHLDPRVGLTQLGLPAEPAGALAGLWGMVQRIVALRRCVRTLRPDVVLSFLVKVNVVTMLATRGLAIPVIVSERNNPREQQVNPLWAWLRRRCYPLADRVVTPTRGVLASLGGLERAQGHVIPNPVDLRRPAVGTRDGTRLVAVGRLEHQKGFDLLLRAFARIAPRHPGWSLVIYGEGPLRPDLETLRDDLGLGGRVLLPGVTTAPGAWTADADAFVLSSRFESFGNVITEAMVAGLPVVAFDCPFGPGDIINGEVDGVLVPAEDVDGLAAALDRLLAEPARRARLAAAAVDNVRRFDRTQVLATWDHLLADVATHPKSTRARGRLAPTT